MKYKYNVSLKELRSSLKYRSREYLLQNSLHGIPYFVDSTRPKWERLIWLFLSMTSVIATFITIVIILNKFQTQPTITGVDVLTEHINIEFPQIFICFDWIHLNHSYILENDMHVYEELYNWNIGKYIDVKSFNPIYKNKNNFREIFKTMGLDCESLFSNCAYRGMNRSCENIFTKVLTAVGICCKSKNLESLKYVDISWNLEFKILNSSFPLRFYLMEQNNLSPEPGERSLIVDKSLDIEFVVDITYTTSDIKYLTLRQRQCYYKQESKNLIDCEIDCITDKLFKYCKCLPWFLSFVDKTECPISKYPCLNNVNIDKTQCNCWPFCDHTSYSVKSMKTFENKNKNQIMLKNWPTALHKTEMRFGYLDLIVSFGGIAGLFLGFSIFVALEFGYYFTLRTYFGAVIRISRKQYNIMTIYVVEKYPNQKVNTNSKYYIYLD